MATYLGEFEVNLEETKFKDFEPFDWALYFIERYGHIDGERIKYWVMDQVARIHSGMDVIVVLAKWDDGTEEYRVRLGEENEKYRQWVHSMEYPDGEDAIDEYGCSMHYEYYNGLN